jgi:RNA polymerase sigma-70 factor (ECF subfamily)
MSRKPVLPQLSALSPVFQAEDDQQLMRRVQDEDVRAFQKLYDRYKGRIMSFLIQMVRQKSVAEELTQEVFLRVYRSRAAYDRQAKFSTWIWTIARNLAYDSLRKKREVLLDPDPEGGTSAIDNLESPLSSAEEQLIEQAAQSKLEHCLQKLAESQREALVLRTFSDNSYEDIADTMQTTLSSVKSLIHRAKESLLKCLGKGAGHE